jgi:hypothetical protein
MTLRKAKGVFVRHNVKLKGRPGLPEGVVLRQTVMFRCADGQKAKLDRLGGSRWMREQIDAAEEPLGELVESGLAGLGRSLPPGVVVESVEDNQPAARPVGGDIVFPKSETPKKDGEPEFGTPEWNAKRKKMIEQMRRERGKE